MPADRIRLPSPAAGAPPEHALVHHLRAGDQGMLDVRGGKRRWRIWVDGGAILATRSNLKSEQPEAVLAKKPGMSASAVARNVVMLQLRGAFSKGTAWTWAPGEQPDAPVEVPGLALLYRALAATRDAAALGPRLAFAPGATITATGDTAALKLPGPLAGWLAAAAGPWADWLAGGPGDEKDRMAAAWLAMGLELLTVEVVEAAPAPAPAPAAPLLDIDALLGDLDPAGPAETAPADDEAPAANPWAPDKVLVPSGAARPEVALAGPPEDFQAAEIEAIGDGEPVKLDDSFFASLNARPDREVVRRQESSATMHSSGSAASAEAAPEEAPPPPPEKHPLEDELRTLHARITAADTHFAALEVEWDAGAEAFRKAHLQLAQKLHPDRYTDASDEVQELANEAFDRIRAAWEVLGQDDERGAYIDRVIHGKKSEEELAMEQVEQYWAGEADFKRGLASFNAGRTRQAHELFVSANEKVPDELEFRAYLGYTTFALHAASDPEKADEGKEMLKDVLEKNKEQTRKLDSAWVLMGRVFREQDNVQGAKRCFVQALKLNPSNGDAQREMRRLTGGSPGKKAAPEEKKGFFSRWFGKK